VWCAREEKAKNWLYWPFCVWCAVCDSKIYEIHSAHVANLTCSPLISSNGKPPPNDHNRTLKKGSFYGHMMMIRCMPHMLFMKRSWLCTLDDIQWHSHNFIHIWIKLLKLIKMKFFKFHHWHSSWSPYFSLSMQGVSTFVVFPLYIMSHAQRSII
jgi:hypothetical protein